MVAKVKIESETKPELKGEEPDKLARNLRQTDQSLIFGKAFKHSVRKILAENLWKF